MKGKRKSAPGKIGEGKNPPEAVADGAGEAASIFPYTQDALELEKHLLAMQKSAEGFVDGKFDGELLDRPGSEFRSAFHILEMPWFMERGKYNHLAGMSDLLDRLDAAYFNMVAALEAAVGGAKLNFEQLRREYGDYARWCDCHGNAAIPDAARFADLGRGYELLEKLRNHAADAMASLPGLMKEKADADMAKEQLNRIDENADKAAARRLKELLAKSKGGKKGAKIAAEIMGDDYLLDRWERHNFVEKRIDAGWKLDAAFAEASKKFGVTSAAIKSSYYRYRNADRKIEKRGKYARTGKQRGRYNTINHVKK